MEKGSELNNSSGIVMSWGFVNIYYLSSTQDHFNRNRIGIELTRFYDYCVYLYCSC